MKVNIYSGQNFEGQKQELPIGRHDIDILKSGIGNDRLSSLYVPDGLQVRLFKHSGFKQALGVFQYDVLALEAKDTGASGVIVEFRPGYYYRIVAEHSRMCLEADTENQGNDALVFHRQHNGEPSQQFEFVPLEGGSYKIVNRHSQKVLGAQGGNVADYTRIVQQAWKNEDYQKWFLEYQEDGTFKIMNKGSQNIVIDIDSKGENAKVYLFGWHGKSNQRFRIERVVAQQPVNTRLPQEKQHYAIYSVATNKPIGIANDAITAGEKVEQQTFETGKNTQRFQFIPLSADVYKIKNVGSGQYLSIPSGKANDEEPLIQDEWSGSPNQMWKLVFHDNGNFLLTALHSRKVIDISGGNTADGTPAIQYGLHGRVNQQFRLEPLPTLPKLKVTDPPAACAPGTADLTASAITAGSDEGQLEYFLDEALQQPIPSPEAVGTGTYYIRLTSPNGFTASAPVTVAVLPQPQLVTTPPAIVCWDEKVDLTAEAITAGSDEGKLEYFLDEQLTQPVPDPKAVEAGTYYIKLSNSAGCTAIGPVTVTTKPEPKLPITNPPAVCWDHKVNLTSPAITAGRDPGELSYFKDDALTQPVPDPKAVEAGAYYIKLKAEDGCTTSQPVEATVKPEPKLPIANPPTVCWDHKVDLTAAAITSGRDSGELFYYKDAALSQPVMTPNAVEAGTYYIQLKTEGGCTTSRPVVASIKPEPKLPITNPPAVCWDHKVDLTAAAITSGRDSGELFYYKDAALSQPVTTPNAVEAGTYYIQLKTEGGCTTSRPVVANIKPEPKLPIANPPAVCWDHKVDLTAAAITSGRDSGELFYYKDAALGQPVTAPNAVEAGTYYIQLKTADGCTTSRPVVASVKPEPRLVVTDPPAVCWDHKIDLTAESITEGSEEGTLSYFKDEALSQSVVDPKAVEAGTYYIQLEIADGCTTSRPVVASVKPEPRLVVHDPEPVYAPKKIDLTAERVTAGSEEGTFTYFKDAGLTQAVEDPEAVKNATYYIQLTKPDGCTSRAKAVKAVVKPRPTLVVPLHLKGIHVPRPTSTVGPTADFSYLPWNDGQRDLNPDYAPLGEYLETTPLESASGRLQAGIHLHWTLPPALARMVKVKDGEDQLPYVPVKWEAIPVSQEGQGELSPETIWSDYLHPEKMPLNLKYAQVPLNHEQGRQPFRYMGVSTNGRDNPPADEKDNKIHHYRHPDFYNRPMTYLGYGSMSFAPFYPDCREVFGHHVPLDSEKHEGLQSVTYFVRATLYREEGGDYPLNQFMNDTGLSLKELFKQFKWALSGDGTPKEIHLAGSVKVAIDPNTPVNQSVDRATKNIQLSLGQTGTEALSAFLASELTAQTGDRSKMEEQLEAILMGDKVTSHHADLSLKFLENRHAHGFRSIQGGHRWALQAQKPEALSDEAFPLQFLDEEAKRRVVRRMVKSHLKPLLAAVAHDEEKTAGFRQQIEELAKKNAAEIKQSLAGFLSQKPADVAPEREPFYSALEKLNRQLDWLDRLEGAAKQLIALNLAQDNYQQSEYQIASMKRELFGDWYKYMLAKYPPPESLEQFDASDYPTPGEAAAWLQHRANAILEKMKTTGKLAIHLEKEGHVQSQLHLDVEGEKATGVLHQFDELKKKTAPATPDSPGIQVVHQPAAPYYEPTDPVLLVAGLDIPEPKLQQDPVIEGYYALDRFPEDSDVQKLKELHQLMVEAPSEKERTGLGIATAQNALWEPFILEWQVEFLPLVDTNGKNAPRNRFTLRENREDTELALSESYESSPATTMRGRTFLTPGAKARKLQVLREFLKLNLKDFGKDYEELHLFWHKERKQYALLGTKEKNTVVQKGYRFVRMEGYAHTLEGPKRSPLKQFWNGDRKDNQLVATQEGEKAALEDGYEYLRGQGFVFQTEGTGRKPLKLYWSETHQDHLTTTDDEAARLAGYQFIRIEGYVLNEDGLLMAKAQEYIQSSQQPYDTNDAVLTAAKAFVKLLDTTVLSQSLGGFNDGLLQLERHLQPGLHDPLGTKEENDFSVGLGRIIQGESRLAPNPAKPFLPLRAGSFRLIGLRLIDTWGRYRDLLKKQEFEPVLSEPLRPIGGKSGWAGLPLRVSQPLRLHAHWLAARKHQDKGVSLEHVPFASPIVGWLCNNPLDRSLMYFSAQGDALGYFNRQGDQKLPPGSTGQAPKVHPALQHVIDHAKDNADWLQGFINATEDALAHIAPHEYQMHRGIAMLLSRPLAIVRMKVSYELLGPPAQNRTWAAFREHIERLEHGEEDIHTHWQHMKLPVRLGNYMMLNDGLVGFWLEDQEGNHNGPLYTTASRTKRPDILPHDNKDALLWLPINGEPVTLTLLIDPRGSMHVTSGVLPVQVLSLRKELLGPALERIGAWFFQAPLLQPKSAKDMLHLSPPEEPGYEWSWLEAANDHRAEEEDQWNKAENFQAAEQKASFKEDSELREGWLKLEHE